MRLRHQLFLVSLLMLCLPWAGCQYIREMENILREEKATTLVATAQAISANLANESNLLDPDAYDAQWFASSDINRVQMYLHPLPQAPRLDARDDDWSYLELEGTSFQHDSTADSDSSTKFTARIYSGLHGENIYLYFRVFDNRWVPHNPQREPRIANGDHILLRSNKWELGVREFYLRTSVTGDITARYINDYGAIRSEPRIHGHWRVKKLGYEVEVQLPRSVVGDRLGYSVVNQIGSGSSTFSAQMKLGTLSVSSSPLPWVSRNKSVEAVLQQYVKDNQTIEVVNRGHWLLAQQGQLQENEEEYSTNNSQRGFLFWIYKLALGGKDFPVLANAAHSGRIDSLEALSAMANESKVQWYSNGQGQRVARAAVPVTVEGQIVGAVLLAESTDEVLSATQSAFTNLFKYTFLAAGIAVIGLAIFASVLSFRIRRLSKAVDTAILEDGRIKEEVLQSGFLQSKAGDEVGDLTRSYGSLLSRLREYTEYLRTLSSKLSHELRTPLAVVKSSLDNIEQEPLNEDMQTYIERAKGGADRLSKLLGAMSAASHMEQSIQSSHVETFNLAVLLKDVVLAYGDTYSKTNIGADIVGPEEDFLWEGAPDLIVQMLDKLVDNAADFAGEGGKVGLGLESKDHELILSVWNTGPSLPGNMQGQLFDSLVSVREPSKQANEQTHLGLGLYIVRLVAEFHGGQVVARNLEDVSGVVFAVSLPVSRPKS